MSEKAVEPSSSSGLESVKIGLTIVLLIGGVAAFYLLGKEPLFVRVAALVAALLIATGVLYTTSVGKTIWQFAFDSRVEVRKMVWPSRQETTQTTLVVVLLIVVIGLFLWGVDSLLAWIVRSIAG
ncbi:preprotein translocase subunit SecE [Halothiobacillus diazotrophicus]|uniref:Protein translocase subunit SecE n=1 Tax=Halothiobacillus diazotrophicus TaxID=1860122 RepID=A0A191ZIS3_9GAMM|nr:preprotein translocase subunit SecE [Halothiobacillus diazotrophicus]ANJ67743.1 preprotein translocase subunit SecE [Halothiobacillus diazotrophicus]